MLCLLPGLTPAAPGRISTRRTESQLRSIKSQIERVTREVTAEQLERDRLTRELRSAEEAVSKARQGLEEVQKERAQGAAQRTVLIHQKQGREGSLDQDRAVLARQLRAAYVAGEESPLKLLLNQKDPALAGRLFIDYSYFGQARAVEIQRVEGEVHVLDQVASDLAAQDRKLAGLEQQQKTEVASLDEARARRSQVLASLTLESRSREKQLDRLRSQQAGLEKLLHELREAAVRFPAVDGHDAFAQLRGKLSWPVHGAEVLARFGQTRAGGLKWDGLLLGTALGEPVRAVYTGRVIFADWLPGLGLLTIIDHGDGYMSLYGHNQQLYKGVGEQVNAGDEIATTGDSGGSNRPELYFEIRKGGKPVDPRPWFRGNP